jgi:hypothetical protein
VPLDGLAEGGMLDRYHLVSFLLRDGTLHDYGEDSPVRSYGCFHGELLAWIAGRLNAQADHGPLEDLAALLQDRPARAVFGVGATRYTALGADDRLRAGDEVVVVVYDADALTLDGVRAHLRDRTPLPPGNPVLWQRVVPTTE